jgi:hypothetical protein
LEKHRRVLIESTGETTSGSNERYRQKKQRVPIEGTGEKQPVPTGGIGETVGSN